MERAAAAAAASAAATAGSSYSLSHVGSSSPVGRGGGPDKAPVCGAHGPRDNGSLLRPRGTPPPEVGAGHSPHPGTVRRRV